MNFADRSDAGRRLGVALSRFRGPDVVVTGLPRGGVPVAYEVATALHAPLDVILVRKIGVPYQPELAMGAVGEDGVRVVNDDVMQVVDVTREEFDRVEAHERVELDQRAARYRSSRAAVPLVDRTVVIVDDGIATGSTARAACRVARAHGARRVVLAVPVAAPRSLAALSQDADDVVCLEAPASFRAVGQFYADFTPTSDDEVMDLLRRAQDQRGESTAVADAADPPVRDEEVWVAVDGGRVAGHLTVPERATAVVVFAHGSGSSRHSSRNRYVAAALNAGGFGTLLFDLLTPEEEQDRSNVFDVELLADRLRAVTRWLRAQPEAAGLPIGYFGASTGAAAALWAAADRAEPVDAVVSRGGRPDLAGPRLASVDVPTLLIVGGHDPVVLDLNREAHAQLGGVSELVVVPGATHLFEEPGALDEVVELARRWFTTYLRRQAGAEDPGRSGSSPRGPARR